MFKTGVVELPSRQLPPFGGALNFVHRRAGYPKRLFNTTRRGVRGCGANASHLPFSHFSVSFPLQSSAFLCALRVSALNPDSSSHFGSGREFKGVGGRG